MSKKKRIAAVLTVIATLCISTLILSQLCLAQERYKIDSTKAAYEFGDVGASYEDYQVQGLVYAEDKLWVLGRAENKLYQYNPETREIVTAYPAPCEAPHGFNWDGSHLLVSDENSHEVYRMNPADGSSETMIKLDECTSDIDLPFTPRDLPLLTAIASDGTYLWAAFSAGYSSSIFKVNLENRKIEKHMWANGPNPEGLYWDGEYLTSIDSRNNEIRKLDREGKAAYVAQLPTKSPRGLTFDGTDYWYFDAEKNQLLKIEWQR